MIGLDTNTVVRLVVSDDPDQARLVVSLIDQALLTSGRLFVNNVVLCESLWVLRSRYGFDRREILSFFEKILACECLEFEDKVHVVEAAEGYSRGDGDFPDLLIAQVNTARGCLHTLTFDRKAARLPEFQLLT